MMRLGRCRPFRRGESAKQSGPSAADHPQECHGPSGAQQATDSTPSWACSGRCWPPLVPGGDDRLGLALAQRLSVPEIVGRMLAARGIDLDAAASFLEPTLRDLLPDPARLRDMDAAAARLAAAIQGGEKIAVFGDYDVDGATSAALLLRFFRAVGVPLRIYIPDRMTEGYGPNAAGAAEAAGGGRRRRHHGRLRHHGLRAAGGRRARPGST